MEQWSCNECSSDVHVYFIHMSLILCLSLLLRELLNIKATSSYCHLFHTCSISICVNKCRAVCSIFGSIIVSQFVCGILILFSSVIFFASVCLSAL